MSEREGSVCQCPRCRQEEDHPDRALHRQMNVLVDHLNEGQRRWYAALESNRMGRGGDTLVSQITGLDEQTIRRGRAELATSLADQPALRVRRLGGGRPKIEKKTPR